MVSNSKQVELFTKGKKNIFKMEKMKMYLYDIFLILMKQSQPQLVKTQQQINCLHKR
jgi:hypothetical protein